MLLLLFEAAGRTFGLDALHVIQVTPVPELDAVPQPFPHVAGQLNFRGRLIPVIDMTDLIENRASKQVLSTRLILALYETGGPDAVVGLIAEHVVETLRCEVSDFSGGSIDTPQMSFLAGTATLDGRSVQRFRLEGAVSDQLRTAYFATN